MGVEQHRREVEAGSLGYAIVTVSDSRTEATDGGGHLLAGKIADSGARLARRTLVHDEVEAIRAAVREALEDRDVDAVLVTGGTGVAARDVTIEAARPLLDKELPGFGEILRMLSFAEVGAAAMLSRATAGVAAGRAVFLLPGSPAALELAMDRLILPEIRHLIAQARRTD
jgi:molybdenum cofactor biosynthesis protein B